MCVLEMISKKYPYEECTNQIQVIRKVTEKKPPNILKNIHPVVRTFIELCIEIDPAKRPTAIELLEHPFLSNMDDLLFNEGTRYVKYLRLKNNENAKTTYDS
jgi:serine/threonine protein kinase